MSPIAPSTVTMMAGAAVNRDIYYFSCSFDDRRIDEPYSRLFFYQEKTNEKWFYHDLPDWRVISTCFIPETSERARSVAALSELGAIEIYSGTGSVFEQIPDAGLAGKGFGYLNRIRCIDGVLFACGYSGQIYRRDESSWLHMDEGLLTEPSPYPGKKRIQSWLARQVACIDILDINGLAQNDLYAVGADGFIAHYDGTKWTTLQCQTQACLHGIFAVSQEEVWIAGSRGTLLKGNVNTGFAAVVKRGMSADFYGVAKYDQQVFIGASDGLYRLEGTDAVVAGPSRDVGIAAVADVEVKDGVLWALASKHLLRFDGASWEVFEHIDNVPC